MTNVGPSPRTGTRVSFVPDFSIFERTAWDVPAIEARCRELATLVPTVTIAVNGTAFHYARGIAARVEELAGTPVEPLHVRADRDGVHVDLALAWVPDRGALRSFVNYCATEGGTHVDGMVEGIRRVLTGRRSGLRRDRVMKWLVPHLLAIVHVMLEGPKWGGPTKDWLKSSEVQDVVADLVERELAAHFERTPAMLDTILLDLQ